MRAAIVVLAATVVSSVLPSQQGPCFRNLVPNGDFEQVFTNAWTFTGPATARSMQFATNGVAVSTAFETTASSAANVAISQSTPVTLQAGVAYEVSIDLWHQIRNVSGVGHVDLGIVLDDGTNVTTALPTTRSTSAGVRRYVGVFVAGSSAASTLSVNISASSFFGPSPVRIDNVVIREFRKAIINAGGARSSGAPTTLTVHGPPNQIFYLLLSPLPVSPSLAVPGCSGSLSLPLPVIQTGVVSTDSAGQWSATVPVPSFAAGLALNWQVVFLPPNCGFTCPVEIGFP